MRDVGLCARDHGSETRGDCKHPLVFDVAKCQVNPRLGDIRFLWHLMLEVFLGLSRHDEQASVWQPFRKGDRAVAWERSGFLNQF